MFLFPKMMIEEKLDTVAHYPAQISVKEPDSFPN